MSKQLNDQNTTAIQRFHPRNLLVMHIFDLNFNISVYQSFLQCSLCLIDHFDFLQVVMVLDKDFRLLETIDDRPLAVDIAVI